MVEGLITSPKEPCRAASFTLVSQHTVGHFDKELEAREGTVVIRLSENFPGVVKIRVRARVGCLIRSENVYLPNETKAGSHRASPRMPHRQCPSFSALPVPRLTARIRGES